MTQVSGIGSGTATLATASAGTGVQPDARARERAELAKTARAFEAIFTRQLMGSMRKAGLGEDIAGSSAVDQFQELSDAKMADGMASQGGLGIANLILQQLDKKTP
ncbi:rod-binding protein [Sphingobium nicotianae]|uniref:Rod-binding protein n=1 Tax=Sphingobium nicotianae TaxID=2782607 RepID=A0A9X1IQZ8_9SPHN|nr:rod-binding protein [Sphingobium nicotianae]MBT2187078.1 rod-binding protein [Sphingobium nicotianae]